MEDNIINKAKNLNIMLIEDSMKDLQLLAHILTEMNYEVSQEMSGEAALASIKIKKPDLILMAARIAGIDGFEVCKRLKAEPDTSKIPIIFIASSENSSDKAIGFKAGGDDFIAKPYEPEDVLARVNNWLEVVFLRRELEKSKQRIADEYESKKSAELSFHQELEKLNNVDPLTGLFNRRVYDREIEKLENNEKYFPITFLLADVNGLGLVNNAFGYQCGDLMLKKVANVLRKECKTDDIITRIGEDMFAVLLPCCDEKNAGLFVERINKALAKESVEKVALSLSMGFSIKNDVFDDMYNVFRKAEDEMYRHKLSDNLSIRSKIIFIIMNALFEKNSVEKSHSKKVSDLSEAIAIKMSLGDYEIKQVKLAGLVHDIGKIGIDEIVLQTKGKLSREDWNEIRRHPEIGYRILSASKGYTEIANFVLDHHERWDGKGYPRGLKGEEISIKARIIAVADAYCDMIAERSYKQKLSEKEAVSEIIRCSGTQFDSEISKIFVEKVLGNTWE